MINHIKQRTIILLGILSISIGGMIYIIFREGNILMFQWFKLLKISRVTDLIRNYGKKITMDFPEWIIYSVPTSLYLLGGALLFLVIWQGKNTGKYWVNSFVGLIILSELGQAVKLVPGTYTNIDLVTIIITYILIYLIIFKSKEH